MEDETEVSRPDDIPNQSTDDSKIEAIENNERPEEDTKEDTNNPDDDNDYYQDDFDNDDVNDEAVNAHQQANAEDKGNEEKGEVEEEANYGDDFEDDAENDVAADDSNADDNPNDAHGVGGNTKHGSENAEEECKPDDQVEKEDTTDKDLKNDLSADDHGEKPPSPSGQEEAGEDRSTLEKEDTDHNVDGKEDEPDAKMDGQLDQEDKRTTDDTLGHDDPENFYESEGENAKQDFTPKPQDEDTKSIISTVSSVLGNSDLIEDLQEIIGSLRADGDRLQDSDGRGSRMSNVDIADMQTRCKSASRMLRKCEKFSTKLGKAITGLRECMSDVKTKVTGQAVENNEHSEIHEKVEVAREVLARAAVDLAEAMKMAAEAEVVTMEATVAAEKVIKDTKSLADDLNKMSETQMDDENNELNDQEERNENQPDLEDKDSTEDTKRETNGEDHLHDEGIVDTGIVGQTEENIYMFQQIPEDDKETEDKTEERMEENDAPESRTPTPRIEVTSPPAPEDEFPLDSFRFEVDSGDWEQGVGCFIRAKEGYLDPDWIQINNLCLYECEPPTSGNEELVSNVIELSPVDQYVEINEPIHVSLPHCCPKSGTNREPVMKIWKEGKWKEVTSSETLFDENKDLRFLETTISSFSTERLAIVTRIKKDKFRVTKRGGKFISSVDNRIVLNVPNGIMKVPNDVILEVHPVDGATLNDYKSRELEDQSPFISTSSILTLTFPSKPSQPVSVSVACPGGPKRKRPKTTNVKEKRSTQRPATSFGFRSRGQDEDEKTEVLLLVENDHGNWVVQKEADVKVSSMNDQVSFEFQAKRQRMMLLRCKPKTSVPTIEQLAKSVENFTYKRFVNFIVRQGTEDMKDLTMHTVLTNKAERIYRKLGEEGFDSGPMMSEDVSVREGQHLEVKFRGNLQPEDYPELDFAYNSALTPSIDCRVCEVEKFAQKSLPCYKGFVQLYTTSERKDTKTGEVTKSEELLTELCITIPKPESEPPKPINRVPVDIKTEGPINNETLRYFARELQTGDDWKKVAKYLRVSPARLQAILRNNHGKPKEEIVFEVLLSWLKQTRKSKDKAMTLAYALQYSGRPDLAEDVRDYDYEYKEERAQSARVSALDKALRGIMRSPELIKHWKRLASNLGLTDDDIDEIVKDNGDPEDQCYEALQKWRETSPGASLTTIADALRASKFWAIADMVENS